jgi:hypothetical protein
VVKRRTGLGTAEARLTLEIPARISWQPIEFHAETRVCGQGPSESGRGKKVNLSGCGFSREKAAQNVGI